MVSKETYKQTYKEQKKPVDTRIPVPRVGYLFSHITPQYAGPDAPAYVHWQAASSTASDS
jgi:hypothetical protein